jgi:hypothetical protein
MNIVIFQWLTVFLCYRFAAKSTALGVASLPQGCAQRRLLLNLHLLNRFRFVIGFLSMERLQAAIRPDRARSDSRRKLRARSQNACPILKCS